MFVLATIMRGGTNYCVRFPTNTQFSFFAFFNPLMQRIYDMNAGCLALRSEQSDFIVAIKRKWIIEYLWIRVYRILW